MKALVGRDHDGWSTRGYLAELDDGQRIQAADAAALVDQLRAAGVTDIQVADAYEGDRSLSRAKREEVLAAWLGRG